MKGERQDPYKVWLSEIMLQQTTVQAVKEYFLAFTRRWPSVDALAEARDEEIMAAWAGLGYYSRARNLIKAARAVAHMRGGVFPETEEALLELPGVGPYTAAAISAIAFDAPSVVVDGNVERVISRIFTISTPLPDAKPEIKLRAGELTPQQRPGDYAQAMMDLGATICTPKKPACVICPVQEFCKAAKEGSPEIYPFKKPKPERPSRLGRAYIAMRPDGTVCLERRQEKGLLGGMAGVPHSDWQEALLPLEKDMARFAPFNAHWQKAGVAKHVFTHFVLEMEVYVARVSYADKPSRGVGERSLFWHEWDGLGAAGLPTVFKKAVNAAAAKLGREEIKRKKA